MPFQKIITEKLSSSVTLQIEKLILRGILRPGDRLPSERELAERFGVSRPSLREAIANLDTRGLLVSKANAGIFVADVLGNAFSPALIELFSSHEESVDDYITFRRDLEGLLRKEQLNMVRVLIYKSYKPSLTKWKQLTRKEIPQMKQDWMLIFIYP